MRDGDNHVQASLATLAGRIGRLALGGIQNRIELLAVEWQEERLRFASLLFRALAFLFLGFMGMLLITATIIFVVPSSARVYVTAGLAVLYLAGAAFSWFALNSAMKHEPFSASVDQVRKDRVWIESLK